MNFRILAKLLGALLILESLAMGACAGFAALDVHGADTSARAALLLSAEITFGAGLLLVLLGFRKIKRIPRREGVAVVGGGWILCGIFGGLPYYLLPEPQLDFAGAIFESISGLTTTGSTVMADIEAWPRALLLWRSTTQWLGGAGIVVLFVALLSYLGMSSKSLFSSESSFQAGEAGKARIRDTAALLWKIYLLITVVCIGGLKGLGMSWFDAINHGFTTVSTGGFSPRNASIAYYSDWGTGLWIELWLSLFMVICSLSFLIWVVIARRGWHRLRAEEEGKMFVLICTGAALAMAAVLAATQDSGFFTALRHTWFTVVSIASTTGFGTVDYEPWPSFALLLIAILMILGGCSGSTAGGMKVSRLIVFLRAARFEIVKAFRPNQVFPMKVNGVPIGPDARATVVRFVGIYAFIIVVSSLAMGVLELGHGIDIETCVGAVLATLPNIGPGFGDVGPSENFAHFLPATKLFLCLLMVLGRLELYTVLVLLVPSLWRKY